MLYKMLLGTNMLEGKEEGNKSVKIENE